MQFDLKILILTSNNCKNIKGSIKKMETKYHNTNATSICDDVSIELGLYPHPRIQDTNTDHSMTSLPLRSSDQKLANCPQIVTSSEQGVRNVGFVHDSSRAVQSMQFPCPSQQTVHTTPQQPVSRGHKAGTQNYLVVAMQFDAQKCLRV